MKADIFTYNTRIAECLFGIFKNIWTSGRYITDYSNFGKLFSFTSIELKDMGKLCKKIDKYVQKDKVKVEMNDIGIGRFISKHGGYEIRNTDTGEILKEVRSHLEETIKQECQ